MFIIFFLLALASFVLMLIGVVSPATISKWERRKISRKLSFLIFSTLTILFFVITVILTPKTAGKSGDKLPDTQAELVATSSQEITPVGTDNQVTPAVAPKEDSAVTEIAATQKPVTAPPSSTAQESYKNPATAEINEYYLVTRVVDGDTIVIEGDKKVRYIGVDTPESVSTKQPIECFGKEASKKNSELVLNKKVKLEKDTSELDKYGRLLRYVYLEDGTFINDYLIRTGYAMSYTYPPDAKYSQQFVAAEKEARDNQRGLWAPNICPAETASQTASPNTATTTTSDSTVSHTWYTSSYYSSEFYYCDTDDGWKGLSPKYLKSFPSVEELLKSYPNRRSHGPC